MVRRGGRLRPGQTWLHPRPHARYLPWVTSERMFNVSGLRFLKKLQIMVPTS